jgi:glycosyltransferase involved in cell wall biosynthesis
MVSIVLVTYNRAQRLRLSIQDILNQTFKDFELIICDDCSTDSTEEVCKEFETLDSRIRYYRHYSNLQMPANCNFGIQKAIYPYVAILHDGDRFKPQLIERWYEAITKHDSVGFVFNTIGSTDANDNLVDCRIEFEEGVIPKDYLLKKIFFRRWLFDSPVWGEAMIKKELLEDYGFLKKRYSFYADVDLWMHILHTHDAYFCAEPLITAPMTTVQPHLFDDNLVKTFLYLFTMQLDHRTKAFKNKPMSLIKELAICWTQGFVNLNYKLLLLVKNFSFQSFIHSAKHLKRSALFLFPWIVVLILYPLLYPFLRLFNFAKKMLRSPQVLQATKGLVLLLNKVMIVSEFDQLLLLA